MSTSAPVNVQIISNDLAISIVSPTNEHVLIGYEIVVKAEFSVGHEVPSLLFRYFVDGIRGESIFCLWQYR